GVIRALLALLALASAWCADEMPGWVFDGILAVESHSTWTDRLHWTDHRPGRAGELGPMQVLYAAYKDVRQPGDSFRRMATDGDYGVEIGVRYLWSLRERGMRWERVVESYHAGPWKRAPGYLAAVKASGGAQ